MAAGMDGYLTKPIRPQELDEILEDYVARRSAAAKTVEIAVTMEMKNSVACGA